jgi:hypothetical protein
MGWSTYLDNAVLDKVFRNTDFTVATAYISLHTGDPGDTGADEFTVGTSSYARKVGTFTAAASSATANGTAVLFTNLPAGTVGYAGVWDAPTGTASNFLMGAALATSKVVNAGDSFQFNAGDIDATHT